MVGSQLSGHALPFRHQRKIPHEGIRFLDFHGRDQGVDDGLDDLDDFLPDLAGGEVIRQVHAQLGDDGGAADLIQLGAAVGALILVGLVIAAADAGFRLHAPAAVQPPAVTREESAAPEVAL